MQNNRRQNQRVPINYPINLKIDTQVTVQGRLKDITEKSAFVLMSHSVYLKVNDEVEFIIKAVSENTEKDVSGIARVSRVAVGEGIVIYFTKFYNDSSLRLLELIQK